LVAVGKVTARAPELRNHVADFSVGALDELAAEGSAAITGAGELHERVDGFLDGG
jgi:hypothetical protein